MSIIENMDTMSREHAAWLDLCQEMILRGVEPNAIESNSLFAAIRKWGEELATLRQRAKDPAIAARALAEAREAFAGQYERGEYPKELVR